MSTLSPHLVNIQQQLAAYLKSRGAEVADLKQKLKAADQRAYTQQLICDYDEKGVSDWHFAKDDMGLLCEYFVMPHIHNPDTRQYFEQLSTNNWEAAKAEDFFRLISLLSSFLSLPRPRSSLAPSGQSGLHPSLIETN